MPSGVYKRSEVHRRKVSEANTGENNPNWKGGVKSFDEKKYSREYNRNYKIARRQLVPAEERRRVVYSSDEERAIGNRVSNHKRRTRIKVAGGNFTVGQWQTLKAQYSWTCPSCRRREPDIKLTIDHIIPVSKGGCNDIINIQPLCKSCNSKKRDIIIPRYDLIV